MRASAVALAASLWLPPLAGCRPAEHLASESIEHEPRWEDVLDGPPELIVRLRPRSLRRDPTYGPLLRGALELARTRSRVVAATRAIESMEDADEVVIAVPSVDEAAVARGDLIVVVIGVRADIDPATLVDGDGNALWSAGPPGRLRELIRGPDPSGDAPDASLFELAGRTWVIVSGRLRARAREALSHASGRRPASPAGAIQSAITGSADDAWLAVARLDGPSFVRRVPALQRPAALAPLGEAMTAISFRLRAASATPLEVLVSYPTADAAVAAERTAAATLEALRRKSPGGLSWLLDARIERVDGGTELRIAAPLPSRIAQLLSPDSGRRAASKAESPAGPR